jgi:diguanylate cyclase (GGDEF)-like protein
MNPLPDIQRALFMQKLAWAVTGARTKQSHVGLLLIDLTNLARINHHYGYEKGDRVLQMVYCQLLALSKLPDSVFRVGSHCFSFILPDLGNPALIALAINRVQRSLESEVHIDSNPHRVDIKIGVAINRDGGQEFMAMLARAEASLSQVKLGVEQRIEELLAERSDEPNEDRLEQLMEAALQENAFELHFQPKVSLATGRVYGAEALLRWQTPEGETVSPETIVEWAHNNGRSYDLTKWVIHRSLRQLSEWSGRFAINMAVNVPSSLAGDPDLPALLHDAVAIWGVPHEAVTVEFTERAIIEDTQSGFDNLQKLRSMGINVSIDDFGTGYSSLSYFKHIPAGELKIDKSFVDSMLEDRQSMELVKIIINIAHLYGLAVVAEGVEDRESLDVLRDLGCDYVQGYYVSRPLPAAEFTEWIDGWRGF